MQRNGRLRRDWISKLAQGSTVHSLKQASTIGHLNTSLGPYFGLSCCIRALAGAVGLSALDGLDWLIASPSSAFAGCC